MNVIPSTGISFGFTGSDVFSNSILIVGSLASFIILGLAIPMTIRLIRMLYFVFSHDEWEDHVSFGDKLYTAGYLLYPERYGSEYEDEDDD
jgi:hypothetical protein